MFEHAKLLDGLTDLDCSEIFCPSEILHAVFNWHTDIEYSDPQDQGK